MVGYLARYPWLAHWLANWVVTCSLAGCFAVWRTDWRGWQAGYLGRPGDLDLAGYLAGCLHGYLVGWQGIWLAI